MSEVFDRIRQYLLPNEDVRLSFQTRSGFLILSSRRIVILNEKNSPGTNIERAIPYECITSIESKKADRFEVAGRVLDQFGRFTNGIKSFEIRVPKGEVQSSFESTMNLCSEIVKEYRATTIPTLDLSYLEVMPECLTRNAILDLNTVLRDKPIHDELVPEAAKFLGNEPFLLEESLRDGTDSENGVLYAAGTQGYYWIQGKKQGRFMSNVIVDTVEWSNVRSLTHQWHEKEAAIYVTYSLTQDGKELTKQFRWRPPINDDTLQFPWFLQQLNGPWIFFDVMSRYSKKSSLSFMIS